MSIRKGDNVIAGASVGFIGKPAWSQAVEITAAQFNAGYTAPADGMIVGFATMGFGDKVAFIYINNTKVSLSRRATGGNLDVRTADIQCIVNKGDVLTASFSYADTSESSLSFVPFEYSGVSDINVITPEYIRNLHDPDWANAVPVTSAQLAAGYTAPSRGMLVGWGNPAVGRGCYITLNNIVIGGFNTAGVFTTISIPTNRGDVIATGQLLDQSDVHFVPYKAQ